MSGRTLAAALREYLLPIRQAVGCITPPILHTVGHAIRPEHTHTLLLRDGASVRVGDGTYRFRFSQRYRFEQSEVPRPRWIAATVGYIYQFEAIRDDRPTEVIAFHWHPEPEQLVRFPHVHLGYGAGNLRHGLDKAHIPTGQLALAEVIRFAITELGVEPLRADWAELLQAQSGDL